MAERADERITIRLTWDELQRIHRAAAITPGSHRASTAVGTFVRRAALAAADAALAGQSQTLLQYRCTCGAEVEAETVENARGWFWAHQMGKTMEKCRGGSRAELRRVISKSGEAVQLSGFPDAINSEGASR